MEPDYPAAHSMDAVWYAVDKNGHVGLFSTGAGGAVPHKAYGPGEHFDDLDLEEEGVIEEALDELPDAKRLFQYETGNLDECLADRYSRKKAPKSPLHVDELPPDVRQALEAMRFDTLDFGQTKVFQPVELTECATWDPAYLSGDGKTVKPVPGREKEYAQFLGDIRDDFEEDGLTVEEPPQPKRAPRKKKGRGGKK